MSRPLTLEIFFDIKMKFTTCALNCQKKNLCSKKRKNQRNVSSHSIQVCLQAEAENLILVIIKRAKTKYISTS